MNNKSEGLSLPALITLAIGTAIGSGIVSVVGQAVEVTGSSAWLAIVITCLLGMFVCAAPAFMCSMMRVDGGNYGFAYTALNDYWAGVIGLSSIANVFSISMFGMAFGMYINVLIPSISPQLAGIIVMTIFFVLNLFGVNAMAKVQNIMAICLIGGLLLFICLGLTNLDPQGTGVFAFSAPTFFSSGFFGILSAIMMMINATTGMRFLVNFSRDAARPKKDIPIAIFAAGLVILVLYSGIAIVECGVLPIDQVAGQTLAVVAQRIMPPQLYIVFMIGGPIMALTTTINSSFSIAVEPIRRAAADGFLPRVFGKCNRHGSPYLLMIICYAFAIAPLLFGINFQSLVNAAMAGATLMQAITWFCYFKAPYKIPEAWEKRYYKIPRGVYNFLTLGGAILWFVLWAVAVVDTPPVLLIAAAVLHVAIFAAPAIAKKMGTVKIENVFDVTIDM